MVNQNVGIPTEGRICRNSHGMMVCVVSRSKSAVAYRWITGPRAGSHGNCSSVDFVRMFTPDQVVYPTAPRKRARIKRRCVTCGEKKLIKAFDKCDRCYKIARRASAASSTTSTPVQTPRLLPHPQLPEQESLSLASCASPDRKRAGLR